MSQIAIIVLDEKIPAKILIAIKQVTNESPEIISSRIARHEALYSTLLFYNNHEEEVNRLKKLTHILQNNNIAFEIFELREEEIFNKASSENYKISLDTLINILNR